MLNTQQFYFWLLHRQFVRFLLIIILAFIVGMIIGLKDIYAESLLNRFVPGAGNVGFASTTGWGSTNAQGTSTSSVTLPQLGAHIRFWHTGPLLQSQDAKSWFNSTGGSTVIIFASGFGDKATTNSGFYKSGGANYFTSFPHNSASCYTHWATGNPC